MRGNDLLAQAALAMIGAAQTPLSGPEPVPAATLTEVAGWLRSQSTAWIFAYNDHVVYSRDDEAALAYADDVCADALRIARTLVAVPQPVWPSMA